LLGHDLCGRKRSAGIEAVVHGDRKKAKSGGEERAEDQAGLWATVFNAVSLKHEA
jgi:uridylate kinase